MVQHSTEDSTTDLVPSEFPKQLDIAQVSVCGLSFLSAGLFLFLPLVNLTASDPLATMDKNHSPHGCNVRMTGNGLYGTFGFSLAAGCR